MTVAGNDQSKCKILATLVAELWFKEDNRYAGAERPQFEGSSRGKGFPMDIVFCV